MDFMGKKTKQKQKPDPPKQQQQLQQQKNRYLNEREKHGNKFMVPDGLQGYHGLLQFFPP